MVTSALVCITIWVQAADSPSLPEGVLAVVDGKSVTLEEYKDYLWRINGAMRLNDYIDSLLVSKKAAELGIAATDDEVRQKVEDDVQRQVEGLFRNDMERWRTALADRGWTVEDYKAQQAVAMRHELLLTACILKARTVTEEKIKARFERDYGVGGVNYELRHILISTRSSRSPAAADPDFEAKARSKAERILRELRDGADFEEMVSLYTDESFSKKRGGRITQYRPNLYGSEEFDAAVQSLTEPGQISGIVKSQRGFHIIQLVARTVTAYEDVKEDIRKILVEEIPGRGEKQEFTKALRDAAAIVR